MLSVGDLLTLALESRQTNGPFTGRVRAELAGPVEDDGVHQSSTLQALLLK